MNISEVEALSLKKLFKVSDYIPRPANVRVNCIAFDYFWGSNYAFLALNVIGSTKTQIGIFDLTSSPIKFVTYKEIDGIVNQYVRTLPPSIPHFH